MVLDINQEVIKNGQHQLKYQDSNNCAVNALAVAFNISYDAAHQYASTAWNRRHGRGTHSSLLINDLKNQTQLKFGKRSKEVPAVTFYRHPHALVKRKMKLSTFMKCYSQGTFYVLVRGHALVIKDGVLIDNSASLSRPVKYAFQIEG